MDHHPPSSRAAGLFTVLFLSGLLVACGGGGGGSAGTACTGDTNGSGNTGGTGDTPTSAPPAPGLTLEYRQTRTFRFTWADVDGETEYRLLENPDGISGFTRVATIAADATEHDQVVFLPARLNARYLLQACNGIGCTDSGEVTVSAAQAASAIGYVKASNTGAGDNFGIALAISGDGRTLAVGAPNEDSAATGVGGSQTNETGNTSGAVYVFVQDAGGIWRQQAYIKASNTGAFDQFGSALALSADGNTLIVGAPYEDSAATGVNGDQADQSARDAGAAYVFTRDGNGAWSQQAYLKASNTEAGDWFGHAVAIAGDGDTVAVGAFYEASTATGVGGNQADNLAYGAGAVYVFTRNAGGTWSQQAYVKASNSANADYFGQAVALSGDGDTLAVGAYMEDSAATGINGDQADNGAVNAGAVYVFTRSAGGTWRQQAYIKASNAGRYDLFGRSVALAADGLTLAVGAPNEFSAATGINGDQTDDSSYLAGAVYVFIRAGGAWSQQAYIKARSIGLDNFGYSVSLSADGNMLAVGALNEDSASRGLAGDPFDNAAFRSGAAYLFARDTSGTWRTQAYLKAPNTETRDRFGRVVALAGTGRVLAVGAPYESSAATGIGGDQTNNTATEAGAVYLY